MEIHFQAKLNIACSTATSLSPLMEKVTVYRTFVSSEPRKVQKVKKVRRSVFWTYISVSNFQFSKGLEDFSAHISSKHMCRFLSSVLLVELSPLEFHPGPCLRSAEAGKRLGTR